MRDSKTSVFKKVIGITKEDYDFIDSIKKKKSKAGMLKLIIKKYKDEQKRRV